MHDDSASNGRATERFLCAFVFQDESQTLGEIHVQLHQVDLLKPEEKKAIDNFRREMISIRKELRGVQFDLRKDIDNLDAWLKFINIAAIPLLLGLGTLVFAVGRRLRRRHGVVETG